jgi:GH15 family glucan-1,4-alpha-glucosidase
VPRDLVIGNGSLQVMFGQGSVSVCPLSWSHAELIIAVRDYVDRRRHFASSRQ